LGKFLQAEGFGPALGQLGVDIFGQGRHDHEERDLAARLVKGFQNGGHRIFSADGPNIFQFA